MQIIFKFGVNVYCLRIHLRNCPAVLQQLVYSRKIFIIVYIVLLGKIAAVAYVDYFLHHFSSVFIFLELKKGNKKTAN